MTDPKSSQELYQRSRSPDKTLRTYDAWHSLTVGEPQETVDAVYRDIIGWLDHRASKEMVDLTIVSPSKLFPPFPTIKRVPPRRMQGASGGGIGVGREGGGQMNSAAEAHQGPMGMRNENCRQPMQPVLQPLHGQPSQPQLHHQQQQPLQIQQNPQFQTQRLLQQQQGERQQHPHALRGAEKGVRKSPSGSREMEPLLP